MTAMIKTLSLVALFFLLQACANFESFNRKPSEKPDTAISAGLVGGTDLGDNSLRINELLHYKVALPQKCRIAIFDLDNADTPTSPTQTDVQTRQQELLSRLRASSRISSAEYLPRLLIGQQTHASALREAAARTQSDLLLTYKSACTKATATNEYHCLVDALLIDTRSGVVTLSVRKSARVDNLSSHDTSNQTLKQAEINAGTVALGDVASAVALHLKEIPVIKNTPVLQAPLNLPKNRSNGLVF